MWRGTRGGEGTDSNQWGPGPLRDGAGGRSAEHTHDQGQPGQPGGQPSCQGNNEIKAQAGVLGFVEGQPLGRERGKLELSEMKRLSAERSACLWTVACGRSFGFRCKVSALPIDSLKSVLEIYLQDK